MLHEISLNDENGPKKDKLNKDNNINFFINLIGLYMNKWVGKAKCFFLYSA
jgi:hypothetical protein